MEEPITRRFRRRLTLGHLMIAIAILAVWLALPTVLRVISMATFDLIPLVDRPRRMVLKPRRRVARWGFLVAATTINLYVAVCCIVPDSNSVAFSLIFPGLLLMGIPMIAALGTSWARLLADDEGADSVQLRDAAGVAVFLIALLPMVTRLTLWPLQLAFLASRPGMERLAKQVAAGTPVSTPQRAGVFQVVASAVEPVAPHYVGLITNPKGYSYTRTGFVKLHPGTRPRTDGPFLGSNCDVYLGEGWWYRDSYVAGRVSSGIAFWANLFSPRAVRVVSAIHECRLRQFSKAIYRQIALSHVSTCGARACMTMML